MATLSELQNSFGSALEAGRTGGAITPPKVSSMEPMVATGPTKVTKPQVSTDDFDEVMHAKLDEVMSKGVPESDAVEIVRELDKRGKIARPEPKKEESTSPVSDFLGGVGVEAPRFVGKALAGAGKLGSYLNPLTYMDEDYAKSAQRGAEMVQAEGERQATEQEQALKKFGVDTTSTAGEIGKGVTKYGIPMAIPLGGGVGASTIGGLAKEGAIFGAKAGGLTAVTEGGAQVTPTDIATQAGIGAVGGAVLNPVASKIVGPTIQKVAEKGVKYGTAFEKGGLQGLGMSASRDFGRATGALPSKAIQGAPKPMMKGNIGGSIGYTEAGEQINIPEKTFTETVKGKLPFIGDIPVEDLMKPNALGETRLSRLAMDAVKPTSSGKGTTALLNKPKDTTEGMKTVWELARTGRIPDADLTTMPGTAKTIVDGLNKYGKQIGDIRAKTFGESIDTSDVAKLAEKVITSEKKYVTGGPGFSEVSRYYDDLNGVNTFDDLWNLKSDLGSEMASLQKQGMGNKTTYRALKDINDALEKKLDNYLTEGINLPPEEMQAYKEALNIYSKLKKVAEPYLKSTIVNERRAQMSLPEQISLIQNGYMDIINSPVQTALRGAGKALAKEIAERNTREGASRQFFDALDRLAKSRTPMSEGAMKEFFTKGVKIPKKQATKSKGIPPKK